MENDILISIIMPFYNNQDQIKDCINSALNQTLRDIEILAINDGGTDASIEILRDIAQKDSRLIIYDLPHQGPGAARNAVLKYAKGKYMFFLDSDDYMYPTQLEKLYAAIEANGAEMVYCRFNKIDEEGNLVSNFYENKLINIVDNTCDVKYLFVENKIIDGKTDHIAWSIFRNLFLTRIVIEHNILFASTSVGEDFVFYMDYMRYCKKACLVDDVLYSYRIYSSGASKHSVERQSHNIIDTTTLLKTKSYSFLDEVSEYTRIEKTFIKKRFNLLLSYNLVINSVLLNANDDEYVAEIKQWYSYLDLLLVYCTSFSKKRLRCLFWFKRGRYDRVLSIIKTGAVHE